VATVATPMEVATLAMAATAATAVKKILDAIMIVSQKK
jgi:hypothetical protein